MDTVPRCGGIHGGLHRQKTWKRDRYAKDTPNFIGNRIGIYAICNCVRTMMEMGMTVEEVDVMAGPATARPKSAAFRTSDLVGLDTLQHVAHNSYDLLRE